MSYETSTLTAPQTGPRRPSLPSNLFESSILASPTLSQHFSNSVSSNSNPSSLAMARKLSLDETGRQATAAVEYISTRSSHSEEQPAESLQQDRQTMSLSPVQMPAALSAHTSYLSSSKQQQQQQQQSFKQMAFSRRDQDDLGSAGGMDWDAANSQLSRTSIGSESMISSTSSSSSIATTASGVSSMAPPSTVNTSYSTPKVCDIPLSASMASPSFAIMSEVTKSEFSSASSAASSQTDDMEDDDDDDLAPPPLSRSCGSMGSLDLQTPARETGHSHDSSSSSTGVRKWDESAPVPVYSLDATIRSPKLMYRSSSHGKDERADGSNQIGVSPLGLRNGLSQSLGLFLGESPNQPSSSSEMRPSNGSPQLFRMQPPPSTSSSLLSKRHSLALSPLKIAPGSSFPRPNQPQTPGGSFFPYARDGAATGEARSPFEPPTPLRALPATVDGFPFGSPMMGNVALRGSSGNGSLSPISADFAAALTISHPKLRDDSQSRSPSPAGSRRTSMMEPSTPSSNKRIKESVDGSRGATTGPTRPKMVKSKSSVGKPYGSPITYRTQQRETSPTLSSPLSKEPTNASGPSPSPSGFVKPLIIATPPQGTEELPMDELPGLPAPILQFPSGSSSSKSTAKEQPSSSTTDARVGKPVQMQAPPMDRSMSEPVFPTVSARHLAHRRLHPVFEAKYTLGHELGSGGFGFVVCATSSVDQRPVAVKFIWKDKVPSHGWVRDPHLGVIPMEAFALKVIDHPNVVKFIELFDDEEFFYLVMEMHGSPWKAPESGDDKLSAKKAVSTASSNSSTPGSPSSLKPPARPVPMERRSSYDLFECIEQHSRLSEEQARWVFAQVVEAVWYLDTLGICHRDIKDENCVVDKDFNVKLIDFGSAVLSDPRKPPPYFNRFFGTMTFASSEILQGKQYRAPHAEVWSLGVLLSILLSGQCPFADPGAAIKGQISKPKGMWTRDSLGLMLRCLEVSPDTRATISEIRNHPWVTKAWEMNNRKRAQPL